VLSSNFTQGTLLVVSRRDEEFFLSLKEVAGELTHLRTVNSSLPLGEDARTPENDDIFEKLWSSLIYQNGSYPSNYRPVTSAVAQMVSARTGAPLPVVCAGIAKKNAS